MIEVYQYSLDAVSWHNKGTGPFPKASPLVASDAYWRTVRYDSESSHVPLPCCAGEEKETDLRLACLEMVMRHAHGAPDMECAINDAKKILSFAKGHE